MVRAWTLGGVLLLVPVLAWAGDDLKRAEAYFRRMDYSRALAAAERVLGEADSGPAELQAAYRVQGLCRAALGRNEQAVESFRRLLAIDPSFRLPEGTSPKLTPPFFQAVGLTVDQGGIRLRHSPSAGEQELGGLELTAELQADPLGMVKAIRFRYWAEGEPPLQMLVDVKGPGKVTVMVPRGFPGPVLRYSFEAVLGTGGALARAGGPGHVFELHTRPKPPAPVAATAGPPAAAGRKTRIARRQDVTAALATPPAQPPAAIESTPVDEQVDDGAWYKSWWFWTVVGVAVAGAAAGTAVGLTAGGGSSDEMKFQIEIR